MELDLGQQLPTGPRIQLDRQPEGQLVTEDLSGPRLQKHARAQHNKGETAVCLELQA